MSLDAEKSGGNNVERRIRRVEILFSIVLALFVIPYVFSILAYIVAAISGNSSSLGFGELVIFAVISVVIAAGIGFAVARLLRRP